MNEWTDERTNQLMTDWLKIWDVWSRILIFLILINNRQVPAQGKTTMGWVATH